MAARKALVHQSCQERAGSHPHAAAVVGATEPVSYGTMNKRANRLAHLLASQGMGPEDVVGLYLSRGSDLVISLLGVLKAGAAYVCLDQMLPPARLATMIPAAGVRLVIADARQGARFETMGCAVLDPADPRLADQPIEDPEPVAAPGNLAYLIFTSGTTGRPKPVAVTHRSLRNHAERMAETFQLSPDDRVLQFAGAGFDVFAEEVFPTLRSGGRLVIAPEPVPVISDFERFLARHRVTVANLPASYWAQWTRDLDVGKRRPPATLRLLVVGSEPSQAGTLTEWRRRCAVPVINAYGTSETTITATSQAFPAHAPAGAGMLPVGTPIGGVTARVLDQAMRPVPTGQPGELYIGGEALARGYHRLPAATAASFVPDPAGKAGERMYRTGDRAREDGSGALHLLGRTDDQVQIRGHRVEPAEVATALLTHPGVADAHVLGTRDGEHGARLVAYVVPRDARRVPQPGELRAHLAAMLPAAMLPQRYVVLEALPRTAHGKIDRAALPAAERGRAGSGGPALAPRTATERQLADLWQEVLGGTVGVTDDLFGLGGHSLTFLRAAALIRDRLGANVSIRDLFAHSTVESQARWLQAAAGAARDPRPGPRGAPIEPQPGVRRAPIEPQPGVRRAPLSLQQEQIWFLTRFAPDSIAYHAQTTIRLVGPLDLDRLDRAIDAITRRHEILRTTYEEVDGRPEQVVHPHEPVRAERVDLGDLPGPDWAARLEEIVERELRRPFDITRLPLIRWTVVRLAPTEHELILVEHHLLHDGWSFALLMRELTLLYGADGSGSPPLPPLPVHYRDYARWQRSSLDGPGMRAHLDYWLNRFHDLPPELPLPLDRPRPAVQSFRGDHLRVELPAGLPAALRSFSQAHRVTLFTTMLAGFFALLYRYTGQGDICVGSGFANRQVSRTEHLLGMFVNTVALRSDISDDPSFAELVERMGEVVLDATTHEELPFPALVRELNPSREAGRNPLTQVLFSVNDALIPDIDLDGTTGTIFERGNGSAKVDIDVVVVPRAESQQADAGHTDDRITLLWEYVVELFDRPTMQRMVDGYLRLLADAVARPACRLSELALLSPTDQARVTSEWSQGAEPAAEAPLIPQAVAVHAAMTPEALALREGGRRLSYRELVSLSARLARRLRALGAGPETIVGVCLPRGADLVVAELGVLFAAAAYVPLDPDNPTSRLVAQCSDAGAALVLTDREGAARLPDERRPLVLDDLLAAAPGPDGAAAQPDGSTEPRPDSLAYLISTSGSTGRPKTVMVDHRALANVVSWRRRSAGLGPGDRTTLVSSPAFDGSVTDVWPALAAGASVHVPDPQTRLDPERLRMWLLAEQITVTDLPTALAERVLELPWPERTPLRLLITAGDRLRIRPRRGTPFALVNEYGPTEATVTATAGLVDPCGEGLPDIGRPIDRVTAYVLDARRQVVPPGVAGELWLGGAGLARGYRGRPGLTADAFPPDPFAARPGARLYRSGDRVRHLPDGRLEFLGRQDSQVVKLRGYRIEPAEIVAALRSHPAVAAAAVLTRAEGPRGEPRLVGYLVPREGQPVPSRSQLREHLTVRLPAYMVPAAWVVLDALPLTPSGKVDERALPAPGPVEPEEYGPPTTDLEKTLVEVWRETLGVERVGLDDNFFDLGGHSLLVAQAQRRLAGLGLDLPIVAFFEYPTIQSLARHLDAGDPPAWAGEESARAARRREGHARLVRLRRAARDAEPAAGLTASVPAAER